MSRSQRQPATEARILLPDVEARRGAASPEDPAMLAMTDFWLVPMRTTSPHTSIEDALQSMKVSGVRFLFVVDAGGVPVGSVTSFDIQGERPLRHMMSIGCTESTCAWRDVLVRDVMDPVDDWRVVDIEDLALWRLGDLPAAMRAPDRGYLVVVERWDQGTAEGTAMRVRGLVSPTTVRQLIGDEAWNTACFPVAYSRDSRGH